MLWEFAGENNAGKSRLAMQLALTVQLPQKLGGVSGAACYVTTREELITPILEGMITDNPLLSPALCGLPDIYTVNAPFFPAVLKVLTESLPTFADERARTLGAKPVKLLVIDTFSDIFDQDKHPEYEDKIHRARDIRRVSLVMHRLASKYNLAVVALGAAKGTRPRFEGGDTGPGELRYSDQERWFARAYSLPGEDANEAILGHVWPNQLNARIMMSRTIRTRPRSAVDPRAQAQGQPPAKRRKVDVDPGRAAGDVDDPSVPLRRFSVIFSSVGPPASCDYVIFDEGVVGIPVEEPPPSTCIYPTPPSSSPGQDGASVPAAQSSGYETAISGWILSTPGAIGSSSESNRGGD
ncbi:hypothetical protein BV20DRAFT_158313 [Pilatotrama ljubarskyi]|nr:hypothetical protein BV20DRAFT_158313 [Pilatotrama ljubarskyi]